MRVLLINPSWNSLISRRGRRYNRAWPPLDLLNCATLLEEDGHEVRLIDARARWIPPADIARIAQDFDRIFVTSSPLDRWQCPNLDTDQFLLTVNALPRDRLFILGAHGTLLPNEFLKLTAARAVVLGEPEFTVQEICRSENLSEVSGLVLQTPQGPVKTPARPLPDVNKLPTPAFHLLDPSLYSYELLGNRFTLLEGARGCPWSCHFCLRAMYGNCYRQKDPDLVLRDVERAVEKFGFRHAYFMDLEFTVHRKLVERLCAFLTRKQYPFQWTCQTRLDAVDADMLGAMRQAGCTLIHYGVESGSERILATLNKRITLDKIKTGMALTRKAGIDAACFFMVGLPDETAADMEMTVALAKSLNPAYASFHVATPYPGTSFHSQYAKEGNFPISESFAQTLPPEELRQRTGRAMREFYLRPSYIASRLRNGHIGSWPKQAKLFWNFIV